LQREDAALRAPVGEIDVVDVDGCGHNGSGCEECSLPSFETGADAPSSG
jgi:hypothetical protein